MRLSFIKKNLSTLGFLLVFLLFSVLMTTAASGAISSPSFAGSTISTVTSANSAPKKVVQALPLAPKTVVGSGPPHLPSAVSTPTPLPVADTATHVSTEPSLNKNNLSFYFQDIDIRALLQLIAKNSGLNFVISDAVKGSITLDLKNVTWQQALATVLESSGLASKQAGSVVYISTIEDLTSYQAKQLQSDQEVLSLSPLRSEIIRLRYSSAKDVANLLKGSSGSLLTARGQIAIDSRTNSVIIRDVRSNLVELVRQIKSLDIPAKQVLIEARIVDIDITYEEQLGVKFGFTKPNQLSGTLHGANQLTQGISAGDVIPIEQRLNFNNAATAITGASPGTIGLALGRIGGVLLDLELSA